MSSSLEAQGKRRKKRENTGYDFDVLVKRVDVKAAPHEAPKPPTKPLALKPASTQTNVAQPGPLNEQRQ